MGKTQRYKLYGIMSYKSNIRDQEQRKNSHHAWRNDNRFSDETSLKKFNSEYKTNRCVKCWLPARTNLREYIEFVNFRDVPHFVQNKHINNEQYANWIMTVYPACKDFIQKYFKQKNSKNY